MPNNNPEGHNQYTKSDSRNAVSGGSSGSGSSSGSTSSSASTSGSAGSSGTTGNPGSGGSTGSSTGKSKRGFASMEPQMQREIASKGGQSQGKENNPGNFANDREKARQAGRKGGEAHGAHR